MAESAYYTAWQMTQNIDLQMRVAAAAQKESGPAEVDIGDPEIWSRDRRWEWATQSDWIAAVQGAQNTGITAWGSNGAVVTDQHILSYVQGALAA
jgi:hypothetical protein